MSDWWDNKKSIKCAFGPKCDKMHVKRAGVNDSQSSKSIQKRPEMYLENLGKNKNKYQFMKPKSRS